MIENENENELTPELIDLLIDSAIKTAKEAERIHYNFVLSKKGRDVLRAKIVHRMKDPIFPAMIERDIAMQVAAFLTGYQYGFDAGIVK